MSNFTRASAREGDAYYLNCRVKHVFFFLFYSEVKNPKPLNQDRIYHILTGGFVKTRRFHLCFQLRLTIQSVSGCCRHKWEPYHYCEIVGVLADRDVISRAFCLDGSPLLSLAHGACLTKPLTHRRRGPSCKKKKNKKKKEKKGKNSQPLSYPPRRLWLYVGHATTRALPHTISSLQLTFFRFCFCTSAFDQTSGLRLIPRRPRQCRVSVQVPQMACRLTDYQVKMEFIWGGAVIENVCCITRCWWGVTSRKLKKKTDIELALFEMLYLKFGRYWEGLTLF